MDIANTTDQDKALLFTTSFLAGGGEMGTLLRNYNWSATCLGPIDTWPHSLRTTLGIILNSKFPMFLFWGPELICFYNDAYRPSLGNDGKHPHALGQPGAEVWPEIWHVIKPLIDDVMAGKEATLFEDQLVPIYRNGKIEDVYWSFSYSAVYTETGQVGGVMVVCSETTTNVNREKEINQKLSFAIDAAELITWDFNPVDGTFSANERYAEWFGFPVTQYYDMQDTLNVVAEEDRERVVAAFMASLSDKHVKYDVEYTIRPAGMPERILRAKGKITAEIGGVASRFSGTIQDVTQQAQARKKIEEREQQVRAIIESAYYPIGVYMGSEMRIQFANQSILNSWGKGPDVIGKLYKDVLPELENQEVFGQLEGVYKTGIPFHARNHMLELVVDGKLQSFYFNYSFTPLINAEGEVYGVVNTGADVTDLVLANQKIERIAEKLKESEERFRIMADASPNMVWALNPDTSLKYMNKFGLEFLDVDLDTFIEQGWHSFVHPDDLDTMGQSLDKAIKNGEQFYKELRLRNYKGEYHWFFSKGAPSYYPNGEMYGYVGSSIDITERKQVEDALALNNTLLMQTNNDLDNFIYTASHDLKAPISNIEGLLQALLRTLPPESLATERAHRITSLMQDSVERFKKTIASLTEVVKLQKEHSEKPVAVNIVEILREVSLDLDPMIQSAGAQIVIDTGDCHAIFFSEKNLRSVVYNLLSNALKYRSQERKPEVRVNCYQLPEYSVLTVSDNGLGISENRISQLFTMFKRFHDHVEGSGIGLYMVKKMIDNVGGTIEVESEVGVGSTFRVYFPR